MKSKVLICTTVLVFAAAAANAHSHRHEAKGHVHGAGKFSITFDKTKGRAELEVPAESILGFEHAPKNDKQKKAYEESMAALETGIAKLVQLDASLNCQFTKDFIGLEKDESGKQSKHADYLATFNVTCDKSPVGSKVIVDFSAYKRLAKLEVTVLADNVVKTVTAKKKPVELDLSAN